MQELQEEAEEEAEAAEAEEEAEAEAEWLKVKDMPAYQENIPIMQDVFTVWHVKPEIQEEENT